MYRYLKGIRVTLSLIFFLGITVLFLDFTELFSTSVFKGFTFLQFVPSLLKFIAVGGLIATGFLVIMIVTILIGRVYCSTVCPLGILQDIISFVSKRFRRKKFRFKYSKPYNILRYSILGIAILASFFGSLTLVAFLDPYSIFGRFSSDFLRPVYTMGNNLIASALEKLHVYGMYIVDIKTVTWSAAIIPGVFLVGITWLAATKGRLYCNTICPVGSLLGFFSKFSIFKLHIDESSCTQCGKCSFACKSSCISIKNQEIDFSRCVGCYNCVKSCSTNSVKYKLAWAPVKPMKTGTQTDPGKRDFLVKSALITAGALGVTNFVKAAANKGAKLISYKKKHLVSPPGSKSIEHFSDKCTACHLCVSACPSGTLQPRFFESGLSGLLQPHVDPTSGFCNFQCTRCGEVCPTGAILPLTVE
ncbi:MAG TPA: 4Fe-4S binding protein, partial [Bacteroidales bacterium]|nr:4Fe-4S binding protein [Bacteroidales bacterium]